MRLFVAAELSDPLFEALCETSALLRGSVRGRFVGSDLFHVTLAFLGEVPVAHACDVADRLRQACDAERPFHTTLGSLGTFGRSSSAVLWQGFRDGASSWGSLARAVRSSLLDAGFDFDNRGFVPHVTLMRRADVSRGVLPMPCVDGGAIETVTLYSSDLSGDRPQYEALERFML